ncbi:AAA family ATPase [Arthrobacter sp. NIO-1057]|uniref:AAA family ATPase n=1 Tax=Arthrobacter sp. NIO-1057 TaxID=993071 RepID=UPI00071D8DC2|nr:AAA family ATPase [Arthrobacter sp. NIO-1057]KSU67220.1 hypothetical protein AS038_05510 [Arthrobacter sp. NIO-1057]SCC01023.1 AAA+-type ATPase, SpoVK/Ycf46/Vps4 family [Arthrobacter sp. NIO-1057]
MAGQEAIESISLGTFRVDEFLAALDLVKFARSRDGLDYAFTGTLVNFRLNSLFLVASDSRGLAYTTMSVDGVEDTNLWAAIPAGLADALDLFVAEEKASFIQRVVDDAIVLEVQSLNQQPLFELDLWDPSQMLENYKQFTTAGLSTKAVLQNDDLQNLGRTGETEEFFIAVTPSSVIFRNDKGKLGSPLTAQVLGIPALIPVDSRWTVGAAFVASSMYQEFGNPSIGVSEDSKILRLTRSSGKNGYVGYCHRYWGSSSSITIYQQRISASARKLARSKPQKSDVLAKLEEFTGQASVKNQVERIVRQVELAKHRAELGLKGSSLTKNFIFSGPPGTGKTSVARLLAELFYALDILPTDKLIEVDRTKLVASHIGGTEEKTQAAIEEALGGVLFIDEAYSLASGGQNDFGPQAIDTLLKGIEDNQGQIVCIAAGYTDEMDGFLKSNPGIPSRFSSFIEFESYSPEELVDIAQIMSRKNDNSLSETAEVLLLQRLTEEELRGGFDKSDWGNARTMRNLMSKSSEYRDLRVSDAQTLDLDSLSTISEEDVLAACDDMGIGRRGTTTERVEDVLAELDAKVGQPKLKAQVRSLCASVEAMQRRAELGQGPIAIDLPHLLFTGPPGTGKTTIARLLARLYRALGLLPSGHVIEVDRSGLVSGYVGQTGPKTNEQIDKAMGGILFIDEAYTLKDDSSNNPGVEAVNTLMKRMSDDKGRFLVIAAGYVEPIQDFLTMNAGLPRRFPTTINFVPYSAVELLQIAEQMIATRGGHLDEEARGYLEERLLKSEKTGAFKSKTWGNAGSIENMVAHAERLRDQRVVSVSEQRPNLEVLNTLKIEDIEPALNELFGGQSEGSESVEDVLAELDAKVGQPQLKAQVKSLRLGVEAMQRRAELGQGPMEIDLPHLLFTGPPGTGKTTIARLLARLYRALGLLHSGHVIEVDRSGLVAGYVGQTAIKTNEAVDRAMGGVLFIDEAYTLKNRSESDFGQEAVETLMKRMSDDAGKFLVIAAGYAGPMQDFLKMNFGLQRRFPTTISFSPYSALELHQIAEQMLGARGGRFEVEAGKHLERRLVSAEKSGIFDSSEWGNAGSIQNLVSHASRLRDQRVLQDPANPRLDKDLNTLTVADIEPALKELLGGNSEVDESVEDVLAELDAKVGQPELKAQVRALRLGVEAKLRRTELGIEQASERLPHLLFVGPPGTGKTTIARLLARLYRALGLLPSGHVVEVDRSGLVSGYVGQTAIKTNEVIDSAMGGVLFVDEAYTLKGRSENDPGVEAVEALMKRMSDDAGKFLVIAAGYAGPMQDFLALNDGLARRFETTIEFFPYSALELVQIAEQMLAAQGGYLDNDALVLLKNRLTCAENNGVFASKSWGNAGSIGNLVAHAARLRDQRVFEISGYQPTAKELTEVLSCDLKPALEELIGREPKTFQELAEKNQDSREVPHYDSDISPDFAEPFEPEQDSIDLVAGYSQAISQVRVDEHPMSRSELPSIVEAGEADLVDELVAGEFVMKPAENSTEAESAETVERLVEELENHVGQEPLKATISEWLAEARAHQTRRALGLRAEENVAEFLLFSGEAGTGKKTIARLLGRLYCALGLLPSNKFEYAALDELTDISNDGFKKWVVEIVSSSTGGVLYLDSRGQRLSDAFVKEFASEAKEILVKSGLYSAIIFAGEDYDLNRFVEAGSTNEVFTFKKLSFEPYDNNELVGIFHAMAMSRQEILDEDVLPELALRLDYAMERRDVRESGKTNANDMGYLLASAEKHRNGRIFSDLLVTPGREELNRISIVDLVAACEGAELIAPRGNETSNLTVVPRSTLPASKVFREEISGQERERRRTAVREQVGNAAQELAPGIVRGSSAPAGPELMALGIQEVYWQGGHSMGMQLRFIPGNKSKMYYFAGGSNGDLPATSGYRGDSVTPEAEIITTEEYPLQTVQDWQESHLSLTRAILDSVRRVLATKDVITESGA